MKATKLRPFLPLLILIGTPLVAIAGPSFGSALTVLAAAPAVAAEPAPMWIWQSPSATNTQKAFFRREFRLPADAEAASLTVTCDNWQRVWLNGKELGFSGDWSVPAIYDVSEAIVPGGKNVIAVEGRNQGGIAALAVRLGVTLEGDKRIFLVSDEKWTASLEAPDGWETVGFSANGWKPASVIAKMGAEPWGEVMPPEGLGNGVPVDMTADVQIAPDFKLEKLYQVPGHQGSWVAMTSDGAGGLLCADQYGKIYQVTPPSGADGKTVVKPTEITLQGAHGLLMFNEVLYVSVNEGSDQAGVWRVTDSDGDGTVEKPELIKAMGGRGEHGPHALVPSPDGKWIYFVAGNHTDLAKMDKSLVPETWAEDQLLPRRPDANGHARDRMAPGGWIARFRPDGSDWELFASGFRNAYDIAFNSEGDLFAYDADMEWDLGMPWYRPTRINHVVPGAEFGWRNGTGKWPAYYEDNLPELVGLGPGSPTGLLSGAGAKFPERYQKALYAFDWTYATIHLVHMTPDGDGYLGTTEEFLSGSGLPLTDAMIGADGDMYFMTGGRRTASALWRVSYTGSDPVEKLVTKAKPLELRSLEGAWDALGSAGRTERFEARIALEHAGAENIATKLANEADAWKTIGGAIALARAADQSHDGIALAALLRLDWAPLTSYQKINWLRAAGLDFARHGEPTSDERIALLRKIDRAFPSGEEDLDRELCRMLSYLQAPGIVGRTLALMDTTGPSPAPDWLELASRNERYGSTVANMVANLPPAQIIHYIYCLRVVKGPWPEAERKRYFEWITLLLEKKGGDSYAGFIKDLRNQTIENATPEEREWIEEFVPAPVKNPLANLPPVEGPGRVWTVEAVEQLAAEGLEGRDLERGKSLYEATLCSACHRFGGAGGSAGPDLTAAGGRFTAKDLAEAIINPSAVISDQYAFDLITKPDGSQVVGKLIEEKDEHWLLATNPFDFSATIEIERNQIKDISRSPVSPMPGGLINRLNPEELKDLMAYLLGK